MVNSSSGVRGFAAKGFHIPYQQGSERFDPRKINAMVSSFLIVILFLTFCLVKHDTSDSITTLQLQKYVNPLWAR